MSKFRLETFRACSRTVMAKFFIETHVQKLPFPCYKQNATISHVELLLLLTVCCFFFWVHLQEGLDVATSDFNTSCGFRGRPGIDHMYQNMVHRYRDVLKLVVTSSPSCKWTQKKRQCTIRNRSRRVRHMMWRYFYCSGEVVCFRTWVPMQKLNCLGPATSARNL